MPTEQDDAEARAILSSALDDDLDDDLLSDAPPPPPPVSSTGSSEHNKKAPPPRKLSPKPQRPGSPRAQSGGATPRGQPRGHPSGTPRAGRGGRGGAQTPTSAHGRAPPMEFPARRTSLSATPPRGAVNQARGPSTRPPPSPQISSPNQPPMSPLPNQPRGAIPNQARGPASSPQMGYMPSPNQPPMSPLSNQPRGAIPNQARGPASSPQMGYTPSPNQPPMSPLPNQPRGAIPNQARGPVSSPQMGYMPSPNQPPMSHHSPNLGSMTPSSFPPPLSNMSPQLTQQSYNQYNQGGGVMNSPNFPPLHPGQRSHGGSSGGGTPRSLTPSSRRSSPGPGTPRSGTPKTPREVLPDLNTNFEDNENGLKQVLNMNWDDVEKKKFETAKDSAEALVTALRNTTDANERATLVANHVAAKGGTLAPQEARIVMTMSKQKKSEEEHLAHLKEIGVEDSSSSDSSSDSDSDSSSDSESDKEEYKARERQNRLSVAAATNKADKLEDQQHKLAQRVRDLEVMLYQMEQRAIIAESASSDIEQKYTAVEQEAKQKAAALESITHELDFKKQKIAVLEARVGGTALPDFKPPAKGAKLSEKDEVGGRISKMRNSFRKNSFTSEGSGKKATTTTAAAAPSTEKKGFWANLLSKSNNESAPPTSSSPNNSEMKEEEEAEPETNDKKKKLEIRKARIGDNGGAIIIRQEPEFPGSSAGALLEGGTEFEFTSVIRKDVEIVVSVAAPSSSNLMSSNSLLSGQITKKISIAFYELKDGRGWVPDFNKSDPLIPLVRITSGIPEDEQLLLDSAKLKKSKSKNSFSLKKSMSSKKSFKEDGEDSLYEPPKKTSSSDKNSSSSRLQSRLASSQDVKKSGAGSPRASISVTASRSGRVSSATAGSATKKKTKKEAEPPPPPPGPQVLDIRFEASKDESLGLVLCPTRFGLEVVHAQGAAALKGVPLGALIDYVGDVKLDNRALLKEKSENFAKELRMKEEEKPTSEFDEENEDQEIKTKEMIDMEKKQLKEKQMELELSLEGMQALEVTEATFRDLVAKVLPRPVHVGFILPADHKAFLEQKNKKLEKDLRLANEQIRNLRATQAKAAAAGAAGGGVGGKVSNAAAVAASLEGKGPKRLTLKQRQEVLRLKQEEMKAARLAKTKSKSSSGGGSSSKGKDDDLPDYLKHCSKAQKNAYLALVASELKYKNECEDMKFKMEDLEAKQQLTEEDAEEHAQLLAQCQSELAGRDAEIDGLLAQIESLKHGAEINDKSVEIMRVKDDRLAWFEGELAHLREEILFTTNLRGDNAQLKEWLEAERAAHAKHLEVYKKNNLELMREKINLQGKVNKLDNAIKTKGLELKDTTSLVKVTKTSAQRRERDFIVDIAREILYSCIESSVYASENICVNKVYSRKPNTPGGLTLTQSIVVNKVKRSGSFLGESFSLGGTFMSPGPMTPSTPKTGGNSKKFFPRENQTPTKQGENGEGAEKVEGIGRKLVRKISSKFEMSQEVSRGRASKQKERKEEISGDGDLVDTLMDKKKLTKKRISFFSCCSSSATYQNDDENENKNENKLKHVKKPKGTDKSSVKGKTKSSSDKDKSSPSPQIHKDSQPVKTSDLMIRSYSNADDDGSDGSEYEEEEEEARGRSSGRVVRHGESGSHLVSSEPAGEDALLSVLPQSSSNLYDSPVGGTTL